MIYVTVGSSRPFTRLIQQVDVLAPRLAEKVIMQTGYDNYRPRNAEFFAFCSHEAQHQYIEKASIVISHNSGGIMLDIAMHKKKAIFVPRKKKYGEAINNNQIDFAKSLENAGKAVKIVYNVAEIEGILKGDYGEIPIPQISTDSKLIEKLREAIIDFALHQSTNHNSLA